MATKRTRSHSPARVRATVPTTATDETAENAPLPMPSTAGIAPEQWLFNMEQWFDASKITDSRVKFALLATTQKPSSYAALQADVRALPHLDPFEIARSHILRQRQSTQHDTVAVDGDRTRSRSAIDPVSNAENQVSVVPSATTEVEPPPPTGIPRDDSEISQALQQMETMLLGKIRAITIDIAELQALYPGSRRRPTETVRTNRAESTRRAQANAPTVSEPC